ncbi:MAG: aspartate/glutamate racemase family protein [Proteobacteria bacterium]|nr:aspartate/glutamate racemase family protein [Pseudomonadota bacterium]
MAVGVFDSGVGGLTIHRELSARLPGADLVYFSDQAHMPYGPRSGAQIVELTQRACERLFAEGCELIVLACNTASAVALRQLQTQWLPQLRRGRARPANILGIIVPTIEAVTGKPWRGPHSPGSTEPRRCVGVFATQATARSQVYEIEIAKRRGDLVAVTEACKGLAALIEQGAPRAELAAVIKEHVAAVAARAGGPPHKVILGCTHYEVCADLFREALPASVELIQQPHATADSLLAYLARHPEYSAGHEGRRRFLTTGRPGTQHRLVETFWGGPLAFEAA